MGSELRRAFSEQINNTKPLTAETVNNVKSNYFNGERHQIGDIVLYAMLVPSKKELMETSEPDPEYIDIDSITLDFDRKSTSECPKIVITLITLNERHFSMFELADFMGGNISQKIPTIQYSETYGIH